MIKSIRLENWKAHLRSEFSFSKGTNVIVGVMGSGKTSIMDAVCFCLYGTFPSLNTRKLSLEETIMAKPNKADSSKLRLEFDYGGKEYAVERVIKRKGSSEAMLYEGGKPISGPKPRDVNERVGEITGISYELFSMAVYSEQNEIDYFLKLSPSDRKKKFDELLQLDRYEAARSNATTVANLLKRSIAERERALQEARKDFSEKELQGANERVEGIKKEIGERKMEAVEVEESGKKNSEALSKLEKSLEKAQDLKRKIAALEERAKVNAKRLQEQEAEIRELKARLNADEIRKNAIKLKKEIDEIGENEEKLNGKTAKLSMEIGGQEAVIKQIEKSAYELKAAKAECPVCHRPLDAHAKGEIEGENKRTVEKCLAEKKRLDAEKLAVEKDVEKLRKEIREKNKALSQLDKELFEAAGAEEREKKAGKVKAEIEKAKEEKKAAEEELSGLSVDEKQIALLRDLVAEAREKRNSLMKEAESKALLMKEIMTNIEMMEKKKRQIGENEAFVKRSNERLDKMKIFGNALAATQAELRDYLIEAINEAMNDAWERVYPYRDFTSAKMAIEGGNYEVVVKDRSGTWTRAEGTLSGGERSTVALTLRIAISLVLTRNLGWIILDEPTHNLDSNAIASLSTMLREHLPELVEQVFIITHEKAMENAASGNLYVLARDKAKDEPARIELI